MADFLQIGINHLAHVKLNAYGLNVLKEAHLCQNGVRGPAFQPPAVDAHGFSRWRLWELFEAFGPCMGAGLHAPWDGDMFIRIEGVEAK